MISVYKYPVKPGQNEIIMPMTAKPLSIGAQGGGLFIWSAVDPDTDPVAYPIYMAMTGEKLPPEAVDRWRFFGTAQIDTMQGLFVVHGFEMGPPRRLRAEEIEALGKVTAQ